MSNGSSSSALGHAALQTVRWLRLCGRLARGYASYGVSLLRERRPQVVQRWPGAIELATAKRVAIFNHFDRNGVVHEFVQRYLDEIAATGFAIVFVSNSPKLPQETIDRLVPITALILRRTNAGKDFGAYKDGIRLAGDISRLERLLIVNDSVYGPFQPLSPVIDEMDMAKADVWAVSDSWEYRYHLQSYFLLFGPRALRSKAFRDFWDGVRYVQAKSWLIHRYEIGLTRRMLAGGLRCRALFPYRDAALAVVEAVQDKKILEDASVSALQKQYISQMFNSVDAGVPLNGMHFFWEYLITNMGCPFIKRELLRDNPARIPFLSYWQRVIAQASETYDTDIILRHLEQSLRDRSV